eukprot:COSAG06_NODE_13310_length_1270_cov_0.717336_1_plen_33_part_10
MQRPRNALKCGTRVLQDRLENLLEGVRLLNCVA